MNENLTDRVILLVKEKGSMHRINPDELRL